MTVPISLQRWTSTASPPAFAIEWTAEPVDASELEQLVATAREAELRGAAFAMVRIRTLEREAWEHVASIANRWSHNARLCLAIDRETLNRVESRELDTERVGLILDDVDAETPLSALARDSVEAIRFRTPFVVQARRSVRAGCVLAAMLDLTTNLGLGTLGPPVAPNDGLSPLLIPAFDFTPSPGLGGIDQPERPARGAALQADGVRQQSRRPTLTAIASSK